MQSRMPETNVMKEHKFELCWESKWINLI